jgi:hypothetical protein
MARIELHKIYPFRKGTDRPISEGHYLTIEMERSKRLLRPFVIVEYSPGYDPFVYSRNEFTNIVEAVAALPGNVARMTEDFSDYQPAKEA